MGSFISADWLLRIDDDLLAHLEYVIVQQFRRGESFLLSWTDGASDSGDSEQHSLWLSPMVPVGFEFDSAEPVPLQLGWATALSAASGSTEGLRIMDTDGLDVPVVTEARR